MVRLAGLGNFKDDDDDEESMNIELRPTAAALLTEEPSPQPCKFDQDPISSESASSPAKVQQPARTPAQTALVAKLLSMRQQRRNFSARQRIALAIGTIPVIVCSLEMIPDRCHVCRENMELDAYFFTAAVFGGIAAVIYGDSLDYWMPRLLGGSMSALGSLFTNWMLLSSIHTNLAFLFVFVGILGAMPGVVIYFLLKVIADECFASDDDDYDEIAPLTKIRITSVD